MTDREILDGFYSKDEWYQENPYAPDTLEEKAKFIIENGLAYKDADYHELRITDISSLNDDGSFDLVVLEDKEGEPYVVCHSEKWISGKNENTVKDILNELQYTFKQTLF